MAEFVTYRVPRDADQFLDPETGNVYGANAHETRRQIIVRHCSDPQPDLQQRQAYEHLLSATP